MFGRGSVKCNDIPQHKQIAMGKMPGGAEAVKPGFKSGSTSKPIGSTGDSSNRMGKL